MLCVDIKRKEIPKKGDLCIYIADLLCYIENNTTLESNYTPIKINLKIQKKKSKIKSKDHSSKNQCGK